MVVKDAELKYHVEPLGSFISFAVSVTFLSVLALFVFRIFQKCSDCCKKPKKEKESVRTKYEPLHKVRSISGALQALSLHQDAEFQIPGMMSSLRVQPDYSTNTSSNGSLSSCEDVCDEKFTEELIQPDSNGNFPLSRQKTYFNTNLEKARHYSSTSEIYECKLMPELYQVNVVQDQNSSSLGKVGYSLQYEDGSKKKLIMIIHEVSDLKFTKTHENVEYLQLSVTLLPEREYVYQTKMIESSTNVKLYDNISFHSRPRNKDFESRTVIVTITYIGIGGKEIPYGESRLPLLSHEIYSQVPTAVSVGVTPITQNEIGDAHIQINYSSIQKQLTVILKTIHFSNISLFDKLGGIHIKTYLLVRGEKQEAKSKKKAISKTIRSNDSRYIDFQDPISFSLSPANCELCTLKMSIHGKHRILVKKLCMGKVKIGENSLDECGRVHWKAVLSMKEVAWTMWHPIYSH